MIRKCITCGEEFETKYAASKYCPEHRRASKKFTISEDNPYTEREVLTNVLEWVKIANGVYVRKNGTDIETKYIYSECAPEVKALLEGKHRQFGDMLKSDIFAMSNVGKELVEPCQME